MYTMGLDIGAIIWLVLIIGGSIAKNIAEQKKKDELRKRQTKKRPQPTQSLSPAEILQKERQLKQQRHKTQSNSLEDLLQQVFEKEQKIKKTVKQKVEPVKAVTPKKQPKKARKKSTDITTTEATKSSYTLAMQDLRKAIITKEIIGKPKALQNDYFY